MAEDFQASVCGGSWWMPPGTTFNRSSCSSVVADMQNFGPFWPRDLVDMKSNSSDTSSDWLQNLLLVQEGLNTFPTSCDDGLEAEDQGFTMDQQQSLDFYPSSLLQSFSNTTFPPSVDDNISSFTPSVLPQFLNPTSYKEKESCQKLSTKINDQKLWGKSSDDLLFKRPRLETPSPLPTFKVRKEKLGDRITALQQLVSPFGKTDTASVLHEAIEYIKLLHDQINILSAPYMKKGATKQFQQYVDQHSSPR